MLTSSDPRCSGLVPKVKEALARAPQSTAAATAFLSLWDDLQLLMHTHMVHEDEVIFPAADDWMPHHSDVFEAEHKEDERQVAEIGPHIVDLAGAVGASGGELSDSRRMAVAALEPLMACHLDFVLRHLRHEEDKFSPLLRKNFAAKTLREVVRKVCIYAFATCCEGHQHVAAALTLSHLSVRALRVCSRPRASTRRAGEHSFVRALTATAAAGVGDHAARGPLPLLPACRQAPAPPPRAARLPQGPPAGHARARAPDWRHARARARRAHLAAHCRGAARPCATWHVRLPPLPVAAPPVSRKKAQGTPEGHWHDSMRMCAWCLQHRMN